MILDQFNQAHAAVINPQASNALHQHALLLTGHTLFPIRECFYSYSDQYQTDPKEQIASPDQAGILQIINDVFVREPERFGDAVTRAAIKQRMGAFFKAYADKKEEIAENVWSHPAHVQRLKEEKRSLNANLFSNIAAVFNEYCQNALNGVSIACVGFDSHFYVEEYGGPQRVVYSEKNRALLGMFDKVYDFYPERGEGAFTLEAIDANHSHTKVDYVVTGNVLNDPSHDLSGHHVFLAAARMLKQGGRALHLLGYSNHFYELHVNNPAMVLIAGQQRIASLPTQHHFLGLEETRLGCQDFVMFEQTREVNLTPRMVSDIIEQGLTISTHNARAVPLITPYIDPGAPQLPTQLARLMQLSGAITHS